MVSRVFLVQDDLVLATAFAAAQRSSAQEIPSETDMVHGEGMLGGKGVRLTSKH